MSNKPKQFIIKMEFEQVITAENKEKAINMFYSKFNAMDLADLNLKINFKDRFKNMKKMIVNDQTHEKIRGSSYNAEENQNSFLELVEEFNSRNR